MVKQARRSVRESAVISFPSSTRNRTGRNLLRLLTLSKQKFADEPTKPHPETVDHA